MAAIKSGTALFAALCLFSFTATADEIVSVEHDGFTVVHMASLPDAGIADVTERVARAIKQVSAWLAQADDWEGTPYAGPIRVLIDPDAHTPSQIRGTIYVPESRVRAALLNDTLATGDFGVVHEITHVLAVSAYRKDRNRFYDDGLAVYLQHRLGPPSNYPTFGVDLHIATAQAANEAGGLLPLDDADEVRRSNESVLRRLGYLQLGSFTQFLIDNYGLGAYLRIYYGAEPSDVTGDSRHDIEQRWRTLILSL